jgi:DNA-binding transcriptional ArsR family regulator
MQKKDELAILMAKISNGRQHKLAFRALEENALAVSEITKRLNNIISDDKSELRLREVSRALKWLAENKLAFSPNYAPQQGIKGVVYRLTNKGKELKKYLEQIEIKSH